MNTGSRKAWVVKTSSGHVESVTEVLSYFQKEIKFQDCSKHLAKSAVKLLTRAVAKSVVIICKEALILVPDQGLVIAGHLLKNRACKIKAMGCFLKYVGNPKTGECGSVL